MSAAQVGEHAQKEHHVQVTPQMVEQIRTLIKEVA
ncbi:MAG: DUF1059 domain-containing protein [Flavisolibacter sp.]|nr:DUF1059 domain-containing protein [Flavisolibacter sp.]